jgi:hypothetical protein
MIEQVLELSSSLMASGTHVWSKGCYNTISTLILKFPLSGAKTKGGGVSHRMAVGLVPALIAHAFTLLNKLLQLLLQLLDRC